MGIRAWSRTLGIAIVAITVVQAQAPAKATQTKLEFGKAGGASLTMDYYAGIGDGLHPIAIAIGVNAWAAKLLAPVEYDVFTLNSPSGETPAAVERAIRYLRFHAREWNGDARRVALLGDAAGGAVAVIAGLANESGVMGSEDSVDRESARVQAVVWVAGVGGATGHDSWQTPLDPLLREKESEAALGRLSEGYLNPYAPAFLLLNGEEDPALPWAQTVKLQNKLKEVGMRCEALRVPQTKPSATPDWQSAVKDWLNKTLDKR